MYNLSPPSHIPRYDADIAWIQTIATAGYMIGINHTNRGTEFFDTSYPTSWRKEYESKRYLWLDPVVVQFLTGDGEKRWSDIKWPDVRGVMKKARKYGLRYGATFVKTVNSNTSMLSVSRSDREINDVEFAQLSAWWSGFVEKANQPLPLTDGELSILRAISQDMSVVAAAQQLGITETAAKSRLKSARTKLNCKSNPAATLILARKKLL